MEKERGSVLRRDRVRRRLSHYPAALFPALLATAAKRGVTLYVSGGALRDWLRGETPEDLDFTIDRGAAAFLEEVRQACGAGTLVRLGERHEDTCRLVLHGLSVDVSGFRGGARTIGADLARRDFTINALAVEVAALAGDDDEIAVIDPLDGRNDLARGIVRACPGAFDDDPLRMLRAFRFAALLDYRIEPATFAAIGARAALIDMSAAERIRYECDKMMLSPRAAPAVQGLAATGLLRRITPELYEGDGVSQPACHHLDVLQHNLFTLGCMERVIAAPDAYFPECGGSLRSYLDDPANAVLLKWAALFHDVGKPATRKRLPEKDNRITFYNHDEEGGRIFLGFGERLRWSRRHRQRVANLITMHMHPFHLCNAQRAAGGLSARARLKLCRRAGVELPGLFLLAMADSLAGQGAGKPEGMEAELAELYRSLDIFYREVVQPTAAKPKLLTGRDLADTLGLAPGPLFGEILEGLDTAVIEGRVADRQEALVWVRRYVAARKGQPQRPDSA